MEGLFFKIIWLCGAVRAFSANEVLCFLRGECCVEELINGVEINWQAINTAICSGLYTINIRAKVSKTLHIVPNMLMCGVEDMRPILVQHDTCMLIS